MWLFGKKMMLTNEHKQLLISTVNELKLDLSSIQIDKLIAYLELLNKWNKVYSLSAIKNPNDMLTHHIFDALSVVSYFIAKGSILDVGSGMGVPAVILAICLPEQKVVAIDSNSKKTAFLRQCKIELKLSNLEVITSRVEEYQATFDIITSRAFANCGLFVALTKHLLATSGRYLAMKSEKGIGELSELVDYKAEVINVNVPHLDASRYLIEIIKND